MSVTITTKKAEPEEITLCARSDYPDKKAIFTVERGVSFGAVKAKALKELKLDEKESYSFIATQYGQDVIEFAHRPDDDKANLRDRMTVFVLAPAHLRPQREIVTEKEKDEEPSSLTKFKGLTPRNALSKLQKASGFKKTTIWQYIDIWANDVVKSKSFLKLDKDQLLDFVKRDTLNVDEADLFDAIMEWSKGQVKETKEKDTSESVKALLKDIIPHVRFGLMTTEQVASKVSGAGVLESQQILDLFTYLAKKSKLGDDEMKTLKTPESLSTFNFKTRIGRVVPMKELTNSSYVNWAQNGYMFDVQAKKGVVITGIGLCTRNAGSHNIQMWWRQGPSASYGARSDGWTPVKDMTPIFEEQQITKLPVELKIKLKAGERCGFYFHTVDSNRGGLVSSGSHSSTDIGSESFSDENLIVYSGPSHTTLWSGEVSYSCVPIATIYYHT